MPPVSESRQPQQSQGGQGGVVLVNLKPNAEPDEVILNANPDPSPAPAPAPKTRPAPPAPAPAPTPAPAPAQPFTPTPLPHVPQPVPAPAAPQPTPSAVEADLLDRLNAEFMEKGEISEETIRALEGNPNLPKGFGRYAKNYATLQQNRRSDNQEAAKQTWGANSPAIESWIASRPDLGIAIVTAPSVAAARIAAQNALTQYAQQNSTAPTVHVVGSGNGAGQAIPPGVPKNKQEKYNAIRDPRFLTNPAYMEKVMKGVARGIELGINYD